MCISATVRLCLTILLGLALAPPGPAQPGPAKPPASSAVQANRILSQPDLTPGIRLSGHLPAWVNPSTDIGPAPDETPIRITLLLARTPTLQAAFDQLLQDQQDPASPRYHYWLTPTQIGEQYGPTPDDLTAVTQWLLHAGLDSPGISPSRTFVTATGRASVLSAAFATTFHFFTVQGAPRLSTTSDPAIPAAFAGVVTAIDGLTDLPIHPLHTARSSPPIPHPESIAPLVTSSGGSHYLFPGDFSLIYDLGPTTRAGNIGRGARVAIVGQSRIATADIVNLELLAGLNTNNVPQTILVPGSADPGIVPIVGTSGDQTEAVLDVGRVLTTANGAQADLVVAAPTAASGGVAAAISYSVNTLLDPILTISFGACEAAAGASAVNFYDTLFAQAAAEGISTFASSGDSGAAGCSLSFTAPTGKEIRGMGNFLCASSYVTCVGGTQFADVGLDAAFWSPENDSFYTSALGYIPEGAWNEPNAISANGRATLQIAGSGSGPSAYIPKPAWQTGIGVPSDGARDTPDVAFSAAGHDGFFACLDAVTTAAPTPHTCVNSSGATYGLIFSGTSASAPSMAAVAALLVAQHGGPLGNLNPTLYRLAASTPSAFHDATPATSGVVSCTTGIASPCNNSIAGAASVSGGLAGYPLQTGYDLVTGLGSLDITNFLRAALGSVTGLTGFTVTANPASIAAGQSAVFTATLSGPASSVPTGTVTFYKGNTLVGSTTLGNGVGATAAIPFPAPGAYNLSAFYSGDAVFAPAMIFVDPFIVTSAPLTLTAFTATPSTALMNQRVVFDASVTPVAGSAVPTGGINFYETVLSGSVLYTNNSHGYAPLLNGKVSLPVLFPRAGVFSLVAVYGGDANFSASSSARVNVTVSAPALIPTTTVLTVSPQSPIPAGSPVVFLANVAASTASPGLAPSSTVQFYANGTPFGTPVTVSSSGAAQIATFPTGTAGNYTITAIYAGDASFAPSTSAPFTLIVTPGASPANLSLTSTPAALTLASSSATSGASTLTLASTSSFTGSAALTCTVVYSGGAAATNPPTCGLSASTLVFTSAASATTTLTLTTAVPHDRPITTAGWLRLPGRLSSAALVLLFLPFARRRRRGFLSILLLAAGLLTLTACGSGGSSIAPNPQTPAGSSKGAYTVTVTATTATQTATTTILLTVI